MKSIFVLIFLLIGCTPVKVSNFGLENLAGWDLNGKRVELQGLAHQRFALNFYSPTCIPCVKEIPALNYLRSQIAGNDVEIYLAVDPYLIVENDTGTIAQILKEATAIMKKEIIARNIKLPVLILEKNLVKEGGLVTGTPETLLFKTRPLLLYYNFIGAISEEQSPDKIKSDNKIKFLTKMLGK